MLRREALKAISALPALSLFPLGKKEPEIPHVDHVPLADLAENIPNGIPIRGALPFLAACPDTVRLRPETEPTGIPHCPPIDVKEFIAWDEKHNWPNKPCGPYSPSEAS